MKGNILAGSLYFLITLVVIFSWFHPGLMYGGGDVGLPTYNPQRILQLILQPWWTETAPGFPRAQNLAAIPAYAFFTSLELFGFPAFMIQAVVFGILLFLMGFGMYLIAKDIMKGENKGVAILAGLFYMVNPYMMVQVWHRFVHGTLFLAASLPILLLLWKKWLTKKSLNSLFLFILINLIFSYMFTSLAHVITLWSLLFIYTLYEMIVPWMGWKNATKFFTYFIFGLTLWILSNTWWILPAFSISPTLASVQHSIAGNLSTLIAISRQSIIPYSLPGLNSFYLFQRFELGDVFKHPLFLFIPYLGVFFIIIGIYYARKSRELIFWSILFILAVFLAKGVASPLGYFYPYLFEKFFFLGILRNPFEKLGLLIPFAGSLLFAIGFFNLASYFWKRNFLAGKALIVLSFGLFFGIYHWPFWTGTLFGTAEKRNYVEIPAYYQQANKWIEAQKKDGNILHLPLAIAESSIYRWPYGYSGAESNVVFFTSNPSISMGFNLPYLDDALQGFDLMASFDQIKYREYLKELFRVFNVRFIVLHYDINWQASIVQSPKKIENILDSLPFLKEQRKIGELTIYEIDERSFLSKIYTASNFNYLETSQHYNTWSWFLRSDPTATLLSDTSGGRGHTNLSGYRQTILIPTTIVKTPPMQLVSEENSLNELPPARFLPDSPLYPMIMLKEFIQTIGYQKIKENIHLTFAGKRLGEVYRIQDKDPNRSISPLIKKYIKHLDKAVDKIFKDGLIIFEAPSEFKILFFRHEVVLGQIYQRAKDQEKAVVSQAIETLRKSMINMKMQPLYELMEESELNKYNRQVYRFFISTDGEYEILMANSKVIPLYQKNLSQLDFQIDDVVQTRNSQIKGDFISFGSINLRTGQHEISFNMQNSLNLFEDNKEEINIASGQHNPNKYEIKVEPFHPNSTYLLSFEYWTKEGSDLIVRTLQDSDPEDYLATDALHQQRDYQFMEPVGFDPYNKYWKTHNINISPRKNSANFSFQIVSAPWDDCRFILAKKQLCDKGEIKYRFEKSSISVIRNIKVYRVLDNKLFLRSKDIGGISGSPPDLTYVKRNPSLYEGTVTIEKPGFMIFSETFNDGWELTLFRDGVEYKVPKHFFANMYGNGWLLDQNGSYKFSIKFTPQNYFYSGIYISIFSLLIFPGIYLITKYIKWSHEKNN